MKRLTFDIEVQDGTDADAVAERMFDWLMEDVEDVFPEITVIYGWDVREVQ